LNNVVLLDSNSVIDHREPNSVIEWNDYTLGLSAINQGVVWVCPTTVWKIDLCLFGKKFKK